MDDIKKNYGINLIDNDCTFIEHQINPSVDKFYNSVFYIEIQNRQKIKQSLE